MKDQLHSRLDGENPGDEFNEDFRMEEEAWGRLLESFRTELPASDPPPWLETRVMAEIEALPEPGVLRRTLSWLMAPQPIRVSPILVGLTAATVALAFLLPRTSPTEAPGDGSPLVYVQFLLEAPGAQSVAVSGDFDAWAGSHELEDADGDGVWTGRVPLEPGVHAYMFLVDGADWMTDPEAQRYAEDGFGNRNAILAVAAPSA